ncbi:MAG: TadE/TadG family type IV pilus assembly protein [Chloroflexota bacterium]
MAEFAIVMPLFAFILVAGLDFGRIFYYSQVIQNCARNGALYESDPVSALRSKYTDYKQAALADAGDLNPALTAAQVTLVTGSDSFGATVAVTVTYNVATLSSYLGFNTMTVTKTVTMRVAQITPD